MLSNSFYKTLESSLSEDGSIKSKLLIDKEHAIFKGHFPGFPIVPGVCMVQMVKEQLEIATQRTLQLQSAGNIKFLSLINPLETPEIEVVVKYKLLEDNSLSAEGSIVVNEQAFFKIVKTVYK